MKILLGLIGLLALGAFVNSSSRVRSFRLKRLFAFLRETESVVYVSIAGELCQLHKTGTYAEMSGETEDTLALVVKNDSVTYYVMIALKKDLTIIGKVKQEGNDHLTKTAKKIRFRPNHMILVMAGVPGGEGYEIAIPRQ